MAQDIIAKDGFGSLYKGLNAGLLRQATYTTARLGIFQVITEKVSAPRRAAGARHSQLGHRAWSCVFLVAARGS